MRILDLVCGTGGRCRGTALSRSHGKYASFPTLAGIAPGLGRAGFSDSTVFSARIMLFRPRGSGRKSIGASREAPLARPLKPRDFLSHMDA